MGKLLEIDLSGVEGMAAALARLGPEAVGRVALDGVNAAAAVARDRILGNMDRINLERSYLQTRVDVRPATSSVTPTAVVYSPFKQTPLGRYAPTYHVKPINDMSYVKRYGRKGHKRYGIDVGEKAAGMTVEVARGQRKYMPHAFVMPLKNGNGFGVFTREGRGLKAYQHRLGPAVYQMFRVAAGKYGDEIAGDLRDAVLERARELFDQELQ